MKIFKGMLLLLLGFFLLLPLSAREWLNENDKVIFEIEGGTRIGYNLDHQVFGIENIVRKLGLWYELLPPEDFSGSPGDPNKDSLQLRAELEGIKFAFKTHQENLSGVGDGFMKYTLEIGSINFQLFWKNLWLSIMSNSQGISMNKAVYEGLFFPQTDWNNDPAKFAPTVSYYTTLSPTVTDKNLGVNFTFPVSLGYLSTGYDGEKVQAEILFGAGGAGFSLTSSEAGLNINNSYALQIDVSAQPFNWLDVSARYAGAFNWQEAGISDLEDNPHIIGGGASLNLALDTSEKIYLTPFFGLDYLFGDNSIFDIKTGAKFLWNGLSGNETNVLSGKTDPRGLSLTTVIHQPEQSSPQVDLQLAIFDPGMENSLVPFLGFSLFGELKNITKNSEIDGGESLYGIGGRLHYLIAAADFTPYLYGHLKQVGTDATDREIATRVGFTYSGLSPNTGLDIYYAMARPTTESSNIGNIAVEVRTKW